MTASSLPVRLSDDMHALFARVRRDGDHLFGSRRVQIVPTTFLVRESSEVSRARIVTPSGVRHVYGKIFRRRPGETELARTRERFSKDYTVTRGVFEAMRSFPELSVVEPIVCYDDLLGVVTSEVPGILLGSAIAHDAAWPLADSRFDSVARALSRVGRWVAVFQRVAPDAAPTPLRLDDIREYIDIRLRRLTALRRASFRESDRQSLLAHFDRLAADVPSSDLVEVPVHGDIVPSNVVIAPDRVTILDFGMTARGSKYLDIARLYTQLEFYTAKPQFRPLVIATLQRAALSGFDSGLRFDDPLFEICAVQHVVCHLLSQSRQPGPFPVSLYSAHQCRRHRRWLRDRARMGAGRAAAGQRVAQMVP